MLLHNFISSFTFDETESMVAKHCDNNEAPAAVQTFSASKFCSYF